MKQQIKTLQLIHLAICAGAIAAYLFAGNLTAESFKIPSIDSDSAIWLLVPVGAIFASNFLFKSQLKQIDFKATIEEKWPIYQTASIIRWAVLEGAAFVLLFVKPEFVLAGILLLLYLIFLRPSEEKILSDLQNLD